MSSSPAVRRAVDRIERMCTRHDDTRELRGRILGELQRWLHFDAYAWLLTDPTTEVGSSPVAEVPWLDQLPRQIGLKYRSAVNRWTSLPEGGAAGLHETTGGHLEQSAVWNELLADHGVSDAASTVYRDRFGCSGFLELWRTDGATFGRDELSILGAVAAAVTNALRRGQAVTFGSGPVPGSAAAGPVLLVLSPELEVRAQTPETETLLRQLVPTGADRRPIPAGAYNVGAQLLAREHGVDHHEPSARIHLAGGLWLTLRAARLDTGNVAVTVERTGPAERLDLFARAHGLTPRESELLAQLAEGADTGTLAARLFVSEHTVQDHLKSIFAKTGARTRPALLSRALGL